MLPPSFVVLSCKFCPLRFATFASIRPRGPEAPDANASGGGRVSRRPSPALRCPPSNRHCRVGSAAQDWPGGLSVTPSNNQARLPMEECPNNRDPPPPEPQGDWPTWHKGEANSPSANRRPTCHWMPPSHGVGGGQLAKIKGNLLDN